MIVINLTSLRLNNSIQFLNTALVRIGFKFMFLNLGSTISENLLFLSFKENPDSFVSISRLDCRFLDELGSKTGLSVLVCVKKD